MKEQHFEGLDQEPEEESRSARKREAQALRRLVEDVADLGELSFKSLVLPEDLKTAIVQARGMKLRSDERRRQLQYAAKVLRGYEDTDFDLFAQVKMLGASSKQDPNAMKLEKIREELISNGKIAIDGFCSLINDTDRNKLRNLVKKASEESALEAGAPKPATRSLYKFIKSEIARAGIEIPDSLL